MQSVRKSGGGKWQGVQSDPVNKNDSSHKIGSNDQSWCQEHILVIANGGYYVPVDATGGFSDAAVVVFDTLVF